MPDIEKLINAIDAASESAYGSETDSELSAQRELAINLYLGRNVDPAPEGRSSVVDRTVYETVQWILPSLCRIFANGDDVVEFIPVGPDDEQKAKQESEYLNYLVTQRNPWFQTCYEWFTDALLTKNAYCWAYMDKRRQVEVEVYENQTPEGVSLLMQEPGAEIVGAEQSETDPNLVTVQVRRSNEKPTLALMVLPPERVKVSQNTSGFSVRTAEYFEYWDYKPISDLRSEGYEVDDDIADDVDTDTLEDTARDLYLEQYRSPDQSPNSPEMRRVRVRYVWIRHDYDEDGIAELQYVLRVGKRVLYREEVNRIPVAAIVPNPLPHRHPGLSVADMVADIQRIKTAILRNALDNLYMSNNPAIAVDKNVVNLDDLLTIRPGQRIRVDGPPQVSFMPVVQPFVFPQAMEALGFMEQMTEGRTGVNRYFQGTDQNALNKTATGIQQLSTMAAQRVELIARIFSSGIEELFSIAHELILKGGHQREVVKLRGGWVEIDPAQWRSRHDMRISVGFAAGNKDAALGRLMQIAMLQEKAMAGGLPIVTPQNVYQTALEITKAADFAAPERFWTDPTQIPPRPPPQPDVTVVTAEQIRAQSTLQKAQIDNETRLKIAEMDQQTEIVKINAAPVIEDQKARTQIAMKERDAQVAVALEDRRAANNPKLVDTKAKATESTALRDAVATFMQSQQSQTQTILEALRTLADSVKVMSAPREAVRGPDGRVVGTRPVVN